MKMDPLLATLSSIRLAYRQFLNTELGAQAYKRFQYRLYSDEDSLVQALNNNILQNLPLISRDILKVCDIGGGDGRRIRKILRFLHEKFGLQFELDFVEQSSCMMRSFAPDDINPFTKTRNFEILFEDARLSGEYDLVFLIHSIFAFDQDSSIDKLLSLPKIDGTILIVSNAQDSFLAGLKEIVDAGHRDQRFEISEMLEILSNRGIRYQQEVFETKWAVSKDDMSQHIEEILEWLSLGKLSLLERECGNEVREYIQRNSVDLGQRVLFTERETVVTMSMEQ